MALLGKRMRDGEHDPVVFLDEYPALAITHLSKIKAACAFWAERKRLQVARTEEELLMKVQDSLSDPALPNDHREVAKWCLKNLFEKRRFKQKQLWLVAPADHGKTTFTNNLREYLRIYEMPLSEQWDDNYTDEDYDMVLLDEFKGQRRVSYINLFVQGGTAAVSRRGTSPYIKKKNLPVIVLSNHVPRTAWRGVDQVDIDAIHARFDVVHVNTWLGTLFAPPLEEDPIEDVLLAPESPPISRRAPIPPSPDSETTDFEGEYDDDMVWSDDEPLGAASLFDTEATCSSSGLRRSDAFYGSHPGL